MRARELYLENLMPDGSSILIASSREAGINYTNSLSNRIAQVLCEDWNRDVLTTYLAGSPGWAGMSSSWLTAHRARMKMTIASPLRLRLLMYTFSMPSLPGPSAQLACSQMRRHEPSSANLCSYWGCGHSCPLSLCPPCPISLPKLPAARTTVMCREDECCAQHSLLPDCMWVCSKSPVHLISAEIPPLPAPMPAAIQQPEHGTQCF